MIVNTSRVVPLRAEHVQSPEGPHLIPVALRDRLPLGARLLIGRLVLLTSGRKALTSGVTHRESFEVAPENHVDASTGHVRRHRDGALATGLGANLGLAKVLLRVQDLVRDAALGTFATQQL